MSEQLTPEWLAEKRRIAEAATPGPWTADAGYIVVLGSDGWAEKRVACLDIDGNSMDDEFIATFDPPTVVALLNEIERLRQERDTLDSGLDGLEQAIQYRDWSAVVAFLRAARKLLDATDELNAALRAPGGASDE